MKQTDKMKKQFATLTLILSLLLPMSLFPQDIPPPPPPGHDQTGNQEGGRGGGAPIGGGLLILLGMAGAYGGIKGYKLYQQKKKSLLD